MLNMLIQKMAATGHNLEPWDYSQDQKTIEDAWEVALGSLVDDDCAIMISNKGLKCKWWPLARLVHVRRR
jgi:hypothetical protein